MANSGNIFEIIANPPGSASTSGSARTLTSATALLRGALTGSSNTHKICDSDDEDDNTPLSDQSSDEDDSALSDREQYVGQDNAENDNASQSDQSNVEDDDTLSTRKKKSSSIQHKAAKTNTKKSKQKRFKKKNKYPTRTVGSTPKPRKRKNKGPGVTLPVRESPRKRRKADTGTLNEYDDENIYDIWDAESETECIEADDADRNEIEPREQIDAQQAKNKSKLDDQKEKWKDAGKTYICQDEICLHL